MTMERETAMKKMMMAVGFVAMVAAGRGKFLFLGIAFQGDILYNTIP